ncbi:MAG TPA: deoxyribodipyrimidine photo-lyase [Stenotrophomonas sp.]|nr:deoxyribodipyrimidine photo-lyase [Stenotrophomonas sp.]
MKTAVVWLRRDLRLDDQPALRAALDAGQVPVPLYIHAPHEEAPWAPGAASRAWLHHSLHALGEDLRARGSDLLLRQGDSAQVLAEVAAASGAEAVYWTRRYEPATQRRDAAIKRQLRESGLSAQSFNGALLFEPWELATRQGGPYKVFTPFWRSALTQWRLPAPWDAPARLPALPKLRGETLAALDLLPSPRWDRGFWQHWQAGEAGARDMLAAFVEGALHGYREQRDLPDRIGTSRLSPHLHFGEIAPWRACHVLMSASDATGAALEADRDAWLRELGWREFAHHLLHHFPHSSERNLDTRFDRFTWAADDEVAVAAWQRGHTGIPIVDAGMRELWATGYMHNRVRMIVASLLCKHLRQHWLVGARWFWDTLVDADLANNSLGWQWVAGTGADAAPYFRIFNPVTQARRFDPHARYISRWVPELAGLPVAQRFAPWEHADALRTLAPGYPSQPVVALGTGRDQALAAYAAMRAQG